MNKISAKNRIEQQMLDTHTTKLICAINYSAEPYCVITENYKFIKNVYKFADLTTIEKLDITLVNFNNVM
jgi:hypothetical protein